MMVIPVMMHRLGVLLNLTKMNMSTTARMAAPTTPVLLAAAMRMHRTHLQNKQAIQRRLRALMLTRKQTAHHLKQTHKIGIRVVAAACTGLAGRVHQCLHHHSAITVTLL